MPKLIIDDFKQHFIDTLSTFENHKRIKMFVKPVWVTGFKNIFICEGKRKKEGIEYLCSTCSKVQFF